MEGGALLVLETHGGEGACLVLESSWGRAPLVLETSWGGRPGSGISMRRALLVL